MIKHVVCRSPSDVAVKWDYEGRGDARFNLKLFKVFDTLSGALDLLKGVSYHTNSPSLTYLDSKSMNGCDNVKGSSKDSVARQIGIIFPNSSRCFHGSYFCDMSHDIDCSEVDDMSEAPDMLS